MCLNTDEVMTHAKTILELEPTSIPVALPPAEPAAVPASEPILMMITANATVDVLSFPFQEAKRAFEHAYLTAQLERCGGKVARLSKLIDIERTHLYRKLRDFDIEWRRKEQDEAGGEVAQ